MYDCAHVNCAAARKSSNEASNWTHPDVLRNQNTVTSVSVAVFAGAESAALGLGTVLTQVAVAVDVAGVSEFVALIVAERWIWEPFRKNDPPATPLGVLLNTVYSMPKDPLVPAVTVPRLTVSPL